MSNPRPDGVTPSQTVGPYFAYGLCPQQYDFDYKSLFTANVVGAETPGEHITLIRRRPA